MNRLRNLWSGTTMFLLAIGSLMLSGCQGGTNNAEPNAVDAKANNARIFRIGPGTDPYMIYVIKGEAMSQTEFSEGCALTVLVPRHPGTVPPTVTASLIGVLNEPATPTAYTLVQPTKPSELPSTNRQIDEFFVKVRRTAAANIDHYCVLELVFSRGNTVIGTERVVFRFKS